MDIIIMTAVVEVLTCSDMLPRTSTGQKVDKNY